jgi:hypothetical protein
VSNWRKRFSIAVWKYVSVCMFQPLNTLLICHPTRFKQATHMLSTWAPCDKFLAKWILVECCSLLLNYNNECDNFSLSWCYLTHIPCTFLCNNVYYRNNNNTCLNNVRVFRYKKLNSFRALLWHKIHYCGSIKSSFSWMITIFCGWMNHILS